MSDFIIFNNFRNGYFLNYVNKNESIKRNTKVGVVFGSNSERTFFCPFDCKISFVYKANYVKKNTILFKIKQIVKNDDHNVIADLVFNNDLNHQNLFQIVDFDKNKNQKK